MSRPWTVQPHADLEKHEDNLWTVEGHMVQMPLPRRATYVRLGDGRIVVHNAVPLREETQTEIERWGEIAFLVVPNGYHRLDIHAYKERYPKLKLLAPPLHAKKIGAVATVDGDLSLLPAGMEHRPVAGTVEEVLIARSGPRASLIFGDLYFDVPGRLPGLKGLFMKTIGSTGGPRIPPLAKFLFVKDKRAFREDYARLAEIPGLARVIPSHGRIGGVEDLRTAIARL